MLRRAILVGVWGVVLATSVRADEGMWLFNRLPADALEDRYGFRPTPEWAEHVMRSSVRISSGGSGSIVSSRGLVLTNHHVVSNYVQELSTPDANLMEAGFFAKSTEEEKRIPSCEVLILWEIEDVTRRIEDSAKDVDDPGAAQLARRAAIAAVEKESKASTGLHSEVVTLYRGGEYHLYRYRRYDDVRLVMVPEVDIAFFGGDADNFEFPRFCLDMAFLRLYEDGKPAEVEHYLTWSQRGVRDEQLVLVSGHPGRTQRLNTVDHLRFYRDVAYPKYLELLYRREIALQQFGLGGPEHERLARDDLFGIQNGRKAVRGILAGLLDPRILAEKSQAESRLRSYVAAHPYAGASSRDWTRLAGAMDGYRSYYDDVMYLNRGRALWSDLFAKATAIVEHVEETKKPNGERLPEYREAALPRLEQRLFSTAPVDADLEIAKLTDSLTDFAAKFSADSPLAMIILAGKAPAQRAYELVSGTKLASVDARRGLVNGGKDAVESSEDPMIRLASALDPHVRSVRKRYESFVQAVQTESYARISRAAFAATGTDVYPDATFTLRLAFGAVRGWNEAGKSIAAFTRMGGAFQKSDERRGKDPYELPDTWKGSKEMIDLATPFNFVSTVDIIGGNSGSPVIDERAELVGLIFDGNIHGLVLDIAYTEEQARAVSVDSRAILESLDKIYGMDGLVKEIVSR